MSRNCACSATTSQLEKVGPTFCRYRKALYFWSLGISLYLELFCFLSFITFVLRNLRSGTHRRNQLFQVSRDDLHSDSWPSTNIFRFRRFCIIKQSFCFRLSGFLFNIICCSKCLPHLRDQPILVTAHISDFLSFLVGLNLYYISQIFGPQDVGAYLHRILLPTK